MPSVSLLPSLPPSLAFILINSAHIFSLSLRKDVERPTPQLTAASLAVLGSRSKAQLRAWRYTAERHEQVSMAQKTSGSEVKMVKWLNEVEKEIRGNGK